MMDEDGALELEIRRKIYTLIERSPGLHERELARLLNIPLSTLDYHLFYMKKRGLLCDQSDGKYTRYYCTCSISGKDKLVLSMLRQKIPRKIVLFLLTHINSTHKTICNHLGVSPSTTSFHLSKLTDLQVVERLDYGRETIFSINNPEHISDLLSTYQKSFIDGAVDSFIATWVEMRPKHLRKKKDEED
jgi:predicted transcriptional regulator